ncbi:dapper homolog 3-like isoform X2 [Bos mutus]|uniref:dapper homolog 3-like isoform X2 n=1 Tax=Bos mutus TaxID=72004 RepID=UPI0038B45DF9
MWGVGEERGPLLREPARERPYRWRVVGEQQHPERARAAAANWGVRRAPVSPRRAGGIPARAAQKRAPAGDHLGRAIEMHVPGPRPQARGHRCEAEPPGFGIYILCWIRSSRNSA